MAGKSIAINMAMIAITTSNSISVNALRDNVDGRITHLAGKNGRGMTNQAKGAKTAGEFASLPRGAIQFSQEIFMHASAVGQFVSQSHGMVVGTSANEELRLSQ